MCVCVEPDLKYTSRNSLHLTLNSVVRRLHTLNNVLKIRHLLQMLGEERKKDSSKFRDGLMLTQIFHDGRG